MTLEMLCLKCTLATCHKGHHLCAINKAERMTKAYWKSRYHKSGQKFRQVRRVVEKRGRSY